MSCRIKLLSSLLVSSIIFLTGCDTNEAPEALAGLRLKGVVTAYLDYSVSRGSGPANATELRAHMKLMPAFILGLTDLKPASIDELLISDRNQQPFVVEYGRKICMSRTGAEPIAYEQTPVDGKRYVAFANGDVKCVKEDEMDQVGMNSPKGF